MRKGELDDGVARLLTQAVEKNYVGLKPRGSGDVIAAATTV